MTDGQPPDALQSKLLGIVQEFKGLNGISAARLAREAKKEPDLVERILKGLEVGGMVRPRKADNLTLWMITVKGEQVLDGHIAEMEVDQVNAIEILVPEQGSIVEVEEDTDVLVDMPTAAPDDPSMWFVCDYVDADGIKCDKRFTTAQGLKHHKTSKHGKQSKKGGRFPCTEKDCNKVFDSAQGLLMHRQRVHLKTLISPGRPTVGSDASINDRIKQLYPDHTPMEIARELGITRKALGKRINRLIEKGELQRKSWRYPPPSIATNRVRHADYYDDIKCLREQGLKKKDIAKRLGLSQNVVNACIQEMIDKGTIKSITHPHGRWQVPKDLVQRREQAVIEGRAAGKSNGQIADELGLDLSGVEKIASRLIEEGRILRRSPVPSAPREPPVINLPVVDRTPHVSSDPLAGLGDLISRLQTIPGIKVNVTIGISLGVGQ